MAVSLPLTEKPGDRIGRYKLLQQVGEGGCGVVYMVGDFPKTIAAQQEATALLKDDTAKKDYLSRLKLYESNQPCRQP